MKWIRAYTSTETRCTPQNQVLGKEDAEVVFPSCGLMRRSSGSVLLGELLSRSTVVVGGFRRKHLVGVLLTVGKSWVDGRKRRLYWAVCFVVSMSQRRGVRIQLFFGLARISLLNFTVFHFIQLHAIIFLAGGGRLAFRRRSITVRLIRIHLFWSGALSRVRTSRHANWRSWLAPDLRLDKLLMPLV